MNLLGLGQTLPDVLVKVLEPLAAANTPLAMLTLGSFIDLHLQEWRPVIAAVAIRVGLGFALGQFLVWGLGLHGLERAAVGMGAAMPIGTVAMVYAALEGLDLGVAAGAISLSIVVALLITPFLLRMY
jgi:predicted permease